MKRQEITLKRMLEDYLIHEVDVMMMCSKGEAGIEPLPEFEEEFDEQQEKCRILREMIQAVQNENVKQAIQDWKNGTMRKWQRDVLEGQVSIDDLKEDNSRNDG